MTTLNGQPTWVFDSYADYAEALIQLQAPTYTNIQADEASLTISVSLNSTN